MSERVKGRWVVVLGGNAFASPDQPLTARRFVATGGERALICNTASLRAALAGNAGTEVRMGTA